MNEFDIKKTFASFSATRVSDARKELIFSELLSLLSSGLDFSNSFRLLIEGEKERKYKVLLQELYGKVVSGMSLWQAIEKCGKFSNLDSGVVRIGEETGKLIEALEFLAGYYARRKEQQRMVKSATSYPLIVLCVAVVVVIFMMSVIVPMFEQVYVRMGGELPALTRWIIGASKQMPAVMLVVTLLLILFGVLYMLFHGTDSWRSAQARLLLGIPVVGNILRKNHQAHFCKLLYLLTASGVPLLTGIEMLGTIITFYPYQRSFADIASDLKRGGLFSASLGRYASIYDRKLVILLRVGEETNRLPQMLRKQGEELSREMEFQLKQLGNMLEPLLILFVGILVAVVLVSMYMPMFKMGGIIG